MKSTQTMKTVFILSLALLMVIIIVGAIFMFHRHVSTIFQNTVIQSINEVQELHKETLREQFDSQFDMLEAQARYFEGVNLSDPKELKRVITSTKGIGDFKKIAVVTNDGSCLNYTGEILSNITTKSYFVSTFVTGLPQVSDKIELDESLEPILTFTYPLIEDGITKAMLIATLPYKALKKQFSVSLFSGKNYVYITTHSGNIILSNRDKNKTLYNVNIYEYLKTNSDNSDKEINQMRMDIIRDYSGYITYHGKDAEKIFAYSPMEINEWYIISVIPYSYIHDQKSAFSSLVIRLFLVLGFAISVFLVVLGILLRRNTTVEKDNERLTIANNQSQALIFEYDVKNHMMEFSGDTQFILGTDKKNIASDIIRTEYFKRVHEDDRSVLDQLQDTITGKNSDFLAEFRYKDYNNEYIWVRMTGTLIRREDRSPAKFIGSINNVNAQVMHEQELRSIAEVDALTTLLNKSAMQEHSSEFLAEKPDDILCAMFMIDLDNFKMVNDTLGHMAGDRAIKDAAKKLSLIFSEKDFISRFGGDEFCILLRINENLGKETFLRVVQEKAQNVCLLLKERYYDEKNIVEVSASVGIALCPEHGITYEDLFHCADEALYNVKQNGKNGYTVWNDSCE